MADNERGKLQLQIESNFEEAIQEVTDLGFNATALIIPRHERPTAMFERRAALAETRAKPTSVEERAQALLQDRRLTAGSFFVSCGARALNCPAALLAFTEKIEAKMAASEKKAAQQKKAEVKREAEAYAVEALGKEVDQHQRRTENRTASLLSVGQGFQQNQRRSGSAERHHHGAGNGYAAAGRRSSCSSPGTAARRPSPASASGAGTSAGTASSCNCRYDDTSPSQCFRGVACEQPAGVISDRISAYLPTQSQPSHRLLCSDAQAGRSKSGQFH